MMPTVWCRTPFDPYAPDPSFLRRLAKFDEGRVRLRWSYDRHKWSIERKMTATVEYVHAIPEYVQRFHPVTQMWEEVPNETYITARDGYLVIDYVSPETPPHDWLIHNLQKYDIRRLGGAKEVVRKLEALEEARKEQKDKASSEELRFIASESYDHLKRRMGEQSFVPKDYKFGDKVY